MSQHEGNTNKGNESEKKSESTEKTILELEQDIAQLKAERRYRKRIRSLRKGELDIDDCDVIPFYRPQDWESREEYEELVAEKVDVPV